jgi:hypothetical protein
MKARSLEERFAQLTAEWQEGTMFWSCPPTEHPAYQKIIGMGWDALPLVLRELEREPDWWFSALAEITGENPVIPDEDVGKLDRIRDHWLTFARYKGWLPWRTA